MVLPLREKGQCVPILPIHHTKETLAHAIARQESRFLPGTSSASPQEEGKGVAQYIFKLADSFFDTMYY